MTTWMVVSEGGQAMSDGLSEREALAEAQDDANRLGQTVFAAEAREGGREVAFEPEPVRYRVTTAAGHSAHAAVDHGSGEMATTIVSTVDRAHEDGTGMAVVDVARTSVEAFEEFLDERDAVVSYAVG